MKLITRRQFGDLARTGLKAPPGGLLLRKDLPVTVEVTGERTRRFVLSTDTPDREYDTIAQSGWQLAAYQLNPVVLWDHGHDPVLGRMPIGRAVTTLVEGGRLVADAAFDDADMPVSGPYAEAVLRKLDNGSLSAVSVGFRALDWSVPEGESARGDSWWPGIDYLKQELLEFSVVAIPCNPEALHQPAPGDSDLVQPDPGAAEAAAAELMLKMAAARARRIRMVDAMG